MTFQKKRYLCRMDRESVQSSDHDNYIIISQINKQKEMIRKLFLPLLVVIAAVMTSCGGKMGALPSEYFSTTPQVLEAVGGKVPVTINGTFPEKYMKKKAVVTVTPVLRYLGGEVKGQPATFQGEKVQANNQTISYKIGGNYTMKAEFDYIPAMAKSELYLTFKAKIGNKEVSVPDVKIADGVIATSTLVSNTLDGASTGQSSDAFQRIIKQAQDARIMFLINRAELRATELKSDGVTDLNQAIVNVNDDPNLRMNNLEISAYASPDGKFDFNEKLAQQRKSNTEKYMAEEMARNQILANIDSKYTAEDWDGFQELVAKSNIQDKELILRVLSMYQDPEQRETEIRNLSAVYGTLADEILPQLRRSRLTLNYDVIGKSDEELNQLAVSQPNTLNIEELLYAATLTDNAAQKETIYKSATQYFPNDYRAYNNLAALSYQKGDFDAAAGYAAKAAGLNANDPEIKVNQALLALKKGDQNTAQTLLGSASASSVANEALGNLYLQQGNYQRAVTAFGDSKTNSAALAQILTSDYNKARTTLDAVPNKDAYTSYLGAVLAARTNNTQGAISNLRDAIDQDPSLARRAATDLEFVKLADNSSFKAIVR